MTSELTRSANDCHFIDGEEVCGFEGMVRVSSQPTNRFFDLLGQIPSVSSLTHRPKKQVKMNPGGEMRVVSDLLETNAAREAVLKEAEMSDAKALVHKVMNDVKRRDPDQTEFHQAVWEVLESLVPVRSQLNTALTPLPPPSTPLTPPPPPPRGRRPITASPPHRPTPSLPHRHHITSPTPSGSREEPSICRPRPSRATR